MTKETRQIVLVGYGLAIVYGIGLLFLLGTWFLHSAALTKSPLFMNKSNVVFWAFFPPQVIALLAVVKLKEWARKFLVGMNLFLCLYVLSRMLITRQPIDFLTAFSVFFYILIILFFNQPKIRAQFRFSSNVSVEPKKKILIVDDDKGLLKMIRAHLLYNGYEVVTAITGEKGLQLAHRRKPDLIILDVILPGIKGREVCVQLKEDSETRDIPVLFLTAKDSPDDVRAEMEVGAIEHLTKPVNLRVLVSEIKKILGS